MIFRIGTRIHQHLANTKKVYTEEGEFNTHLPIVNIDTFGEVIPGALGENDTIRTKIQIFDDGEKNNKVTDVPAIDILSEIRIRGASSREFDKKNYLLKFVNEDGSSNKKSVMGMGDSNEWILHGPFLDKTLIRNYMWYNIGAEIMGYAPNCRFCEVIINGEYKGLYLMVDSIEVGENKINILENKKDSIVSSYIIRLDRGSLNENKNLYNFTKYTKRIKKDQQIDIIYPKIDEKNLKVKEYIEKDLSKFEKSLYSFDYKQYRKFIDIDSFVDYFIINEFTQNYDAGNLSTFVYKNIDGKLKFCIWDFNSSCNNYRKSTIDKDFDLEFDIWYDMLLKDEAFVNKIIYRYRQLRKTYLNEDYLLNYMDETIAYLGDAKTRNFDKWGYTFLPENDLLPEGRKVGSYEEAVQKMKDFIKKRGKWLDEHIEELYQFSHESVNKKYNN